MEEMETMLSFGSYLKKLRIKAGMSLRELQAKTGISNGYLSQLENGQRKRAQPEKIKKLSKTFDVSYDEMMEKAGYYDEWKVDMNDEIERAFAFVVSDPKYRHGTRLTGKLDRQAKKFIIEMYENATGKKLLTEQENAHTEK